MRSKILAVTAASLLVLLYFLSSTPILASSGYSSSASYFFSYKVKPGDYLSLIGTNFGVPWQNIATTNGIAIPYVISGGETLSIPLSSPTIQYSVRAGDSLGLIAQTYEINWQSIAFGNRIASPYTIFPGELLRIPLFANYAYVVQSGDTLTLIGARFNLPRQSIEAANNIQPPYLIYPGENLRMPMQTPNFFRQTWVWLWENYSGGLNELAQNPGSISVVSPNTYVLFNDGTFGLASAQAEICPQVHALGMLCEPLIQNDQSNPSGINNLLSNPSLQTQFIEQAVSAAKSSGLDGYNVDFEPSAGTWNLASQYGVFLTNFANAMHAIGKQLSDDVATWDGGALWNLGIEGSSTVDLVLTMGTYDGSYSTFTHQLQLILNSVPLEKVAVGLLTVDDDATLSQRMQAIQSAGVSTVMVWPSYPNFLSAPYWSALAGFNGN